MSRNLETINLWYSCLFVILIIFHLCKSIVEQIKYFTRNYYVGTCLKKSQLFNRTNLSRDAYVKSVSLIESLNTFKKCRANGISFIGNSASGNSKNNIQIVGISKSYSQEYGFRKYYTTSKNMQFILRTN